MKFEKVITFSWKELLEEKNLGKNIENILKQNVRISKKYIYII